MNAMQATSFEEVQRFVREHERIHVRGAGTKSPSVADSLRGGVGQREVAILDVSRLRGITEYEPGEFTFTALPGTPLCDIAVELAKHGQYLPFDPPLVERGATLGGTVACGLSGPGRLRYGGVRDFIIGVRFVDGNGTLVHGGGKVVKNAAGFDLPKLMVGSLGTLGVMVELTFKVFPAPRATSTLRFDFARLADALAAVPKITAAPLDLDAVEIEPSGLLVVRIAGESDALPARAKRVEAVVGRGAFVMSHDEATSYWRRVDELMFVDQPAIVVRVPVTPARIGSLDERLQSLGVTRRYSVAGNLAWIALPFADGCDALDSVLTHVELGGLVVLGSTGQRWLGFEAGRALARRVKGALDPVNRFEGFGLQPLAISGVTR